MIEWYGYIHINGSLHVKRYFDRGDIEEASSSPFVASITGCPIEAASREEAVKEISKILNYMRR